MASTLGPLSYLKLRYKAELNIDIDESAALVEVMLTDSAESKGWNVSLCGQGLLAQFRSNEDLPVWVAQILREDAEVLFAFENSTRRKLFCQVLKVDSIGPKLAALTVASLSDSHFLQMAQSGQPPSGLKVSGLGPKKLEKLAQGLKRAAKKIIALCSQGNLSSLESSKSSSASFAGTEIPQEIRWSLEKLGLRSVELDQILSGLDAEGVEWRKLNSALILQTVFKKWAKLKSKHKEVSL